MRAGPFFFMAITVTKLEVCNRALGRLGQVMISDFDALTVVPTACRQFYDSCRLQLLRAHPWNFAMKREPLAQMNDEPRFGPTQQYLLPPGCVSALDCYTDIDGRCKIDRFSVENGRLLTDHENCYLLYVHDYTDPTSWDSVFTEAMVCFLASQLAVKLTGDQSLRVALLQELDQVIIPKATLYNSWEDSSNENNPVQDFMNGAAINRYSSGYGGFGFGGRIIDTSNVYTPLY